MDNIFEFDNEAFSMSVKEASNIDPQQKILLEVTLQALEDSNIKYRGSKTGVFIGTGQVDFSELSLSKVQYINEHTASGSALSIHSNLLSYKFDLRGPSLSIDTACSSSGTAMCLATRAIEFGDCDQAVVGGINIIMNQGMSIAFSKLGVLSVDGKCKSFDEDANGYVRSEGCGVVIIKKLEEAIKDKNHIYSVIKSSQFNEDGALSPSLTMPSSEAQQTVMKSTLEKSKIDPNQVYYFEAHATGTKIGDPSETNAIGSIFGENRKDKLRLGSVKSNIGHCECASYMASLIKVSMMLDKGLLVPSINFKNPNPKIKFEEYNLQVQQQVEEFDPKGKVFGISSFGFGGANVCTLLEGVEKTKKTNSDWKLPKPYIFLVKAQTETALKDRLYLLKKEMMEKDQHQVMYTLNTFYQEKYRYLTYGIGENISTAKFYDEIRTSDEKIPICIIFSGQGPQNINMGRTLFKTFPCFKKTIEKCDELYQKHSGISLIKDIGLFGEFVGNKDDIHKIHITLPSLIFLQIGLFELWKSFGLEPTCMMGHSFGEMCAIYASNACTLEEVIETTATRAQLMTKLDKQGTMCAVGCSPQECNEIISKLKLEKIWIAAHNSPQSCTLGGIVESVQKIGEFCKNQKIFFRELSVTNAYHTPLLSSLKDLAIEKFSNTVKQTKKPTKPIVSTVTGDFWTEEFKAEYFWENIEKGVLFQTSIERVMEKYGKNTIFLEMAPHPVLSMSMKQCGAKNVIYSMHREEVEQITMFRAIGNLTGYSYEFDWEKIVGENQRLKLPDYPFQRKQCFSENEFHRNARYVEEYNRSTPITFLGTLSHNSTETWNNLINTKAFPFLEDHVVQQTKVFPGAGYMEFALEIFGKRLGTEIINFEILSAIVVPTDNSFYHVEITKTLDQVSIFGKKENDREWTLHSKAKCGNGNISKDFSNVNIEDIKKCCNKLLQKSDIYNRFDMMGLSYGPQFQCLTSLLQGDEESLGTISIKDLKNLDHFILHPSILDCSFQSFLGAIKNCSRTYLPVSIDSFIILNEISEEFYTHCNVTIYTQEIIKGNIKAFDKNGKVLFYISGFTGKAIKQKKSVETFILTTHFQEKALSKIEFSTKLDFESKEWEKVHSQIPEIDQLISHYWKQSISKIDEKDLDLAQQKYLAWGKTFIKNHQSKETISDIQGFEIELKLIKRVGEKLPELVMNKNNDVANIMFSDKSIDDIYSSSISFRPALDNFVHLFANALAEIEPKRVIKILELGAGTGGLTQMLLPILQKFNGRVEYYFSDLSSNFCFQAEKRFQEYTFVQYKVLNVENSFSEQGFYDHSFDIVVAYDVVHATPDLLKVMKNISKSLVPNGLLMLIEPTHIYSYMDFIFGVFKGWWSFTDQRTQCCLVENEWKNYLSHDFEQTVIYNIPEHVHSVIISKKKQNDTCSIQYSLFTKKEPLELLKYLQENIQNKLPLLVVTQSAQMETNHPDQTSLIGLTRVAANEFKDWNIKTIDIGIDDNIEKINTFLPYLEFENVIRENHLYVPRILEVKNENQEENNVKTPYRLEIDTPGILSTLEYHHFEFPDLLPDEVKVKVHASALNFKDIMLAMNMLDIKDKRLGLEFSGIIEQVGKDVTKFKVGDAVFGFAKNSFASHVSTSEHLIVKKPLHLSFVDACSIPAVFVTPYYALVHKVHMEENQSILVHSAAGGVGQATIQIVNHLKGEVIATVGSQEKREFLKKKYNVKHFANSHESNWDKEVLKIKEKGVDVVLNSLAKEHIEKGIKVLAPYGSFVEIGKRDLLENNSIHLAPFLNNLSYFSVHLDYMFDQKKEVIGKVLSEVAALFEKKIFQPIVDKVYPCENIKDAFNFMKSGKHMGKIVIDFETDPKLVLPSNDLFSSKKSYILSGGLGAVGFEMTKWMVQKGAKHIILLSRTGTLSKYQQREINEMKQSGANIIISLTDTSSEVAVKKCLSMISEKNLPKVGGIFHLAMVLDDIRIDKMSKESFLKVYDPKVIGAKNLIKEFLPKDLDFFILFSSISSIIGNLEQGNYVAANAFLDGFAQKLAHQGYKAHVVNLGAVDDVGVIANDFQLRKILQLRNVQNKLFTVEKIFEVLTFILKSKTVQVIPYFEMGSLCKNFSLVFEKCSHLVTKQYEEVGDGKKANINADALKLIIGKMLQIEPSSINENEKLITYGIDSIGAVELSSILSSKFGISLSQMEILGGASISSILVK